MKILFLADEESKMYWEYFKKEDFKGIDIIVSCGDLNPSYLSFLTTMVGVPLLYVHGNHDDKYNVKPPEGCICIEDEIYEYEGVRFLGLGGSNRLNVHGDDLAGIHIKKVFQQLVTQIRSSDGQEADCAEDAAHLKGTAVLKGQRSGRNGILYGQAAGYKVFPVKVKLAGTIHVQHPVHQPQTLRTVQRLCQNA